MLAGRDIVYLLNAAARTDNPLEGMSPGVRHQARRVRPKAGGGLVIGCGDAVNTDAYNRVLGGARAGLLPLPAGRRAEHHRGGPVRAVGREHRRRTPCSAR